MLHAHPADWPAGLARTWATRYTHFLTLAVAVREFARKGWPTAAIQDQAADAARGAVDAADHLRAHGYAPHLWVGGEEAELWEQAVGLVTALPSPTPPADATADELADWLDRRRAAWRGFAGFVATLGDDAFAQAAALAPQAGRPEGLAALLGQRVQMPAPAQGFRQPPDELPDPVVTVLDAD